MKKIVKIMDMITDMITEIVEQTLNTIAEFTQELGCYLIWIVFVITSPVWVLPYKFIRDILLPDWREIKERGKKDGESGN